jgi:L-asparaginase/Glu-tRNA(Gln) amidotransferase subunit D
MGERVKERYKLKAVATHKLFSSEAKVLMIYTGGTIGMIDKGHGYEPLEDFFETTLRGLSYFHDEEEY